MNRKTLAFIIPAVALAVIALLAVGCPRHASLAPSDLPDGIVGAPYEVTFTLRGQSSPVSRFAVGEGSLPDGLALQPVPDDDKPGIHPGEPLRITGVPTRAGTFEFTLLVRTFGTQKHGLSIDQAYTLTIQQPDESAIPDAGNEERGRERES